MLCLLNSAVLLVRLSIAAESGSEPFQVSGTSFLWRLPHPPIYLWNLERRAFVDTTVNVAKVFFKKPLIFRVEIVFVVSSQVASAAESTVRPLLVECTCEGRWAFCTSQDLATRE